jgi:hypothetical protein
MLTALLLLIWIFALAALAFWTLGAWGVSALAQVDWGSTAAVEAALNGTLGKWLNGTPAEAWLPALTDMVRVAGGALSGLGSWLPTVTWTLWGIGTAVMVGIAIIASLVATWAVRTFRPAKPTAA